MQTIKLKINIARLTALLISISLAMSGIVLFNIGINVRMIHILIPVLFLILVLTKFRWLSSTLYSCSKNSLFIWYIIYLVLMFFTTKNIAPEPLDGLKLWFAVIFNSILGLIFYGVFSEDKVNSIFILKLAYFSIIFFCLVILVQFILSFLGVYEPHMYGKNGFFLLGRPAAFLKDPGWLAYWVIIFSLIVFENRRIKKINRIEFNFFLLVLMIGLLICQSRVSIFFVLLNFYIFVLYKKNLNRFLWLLLGTLLIAIILVFIYIGIIHIPENFYYDIVKLKANPRIYDTITIYNEFVKSNNIWFGNGLGSLDRLVEIYPWRNYTNASNVIYMQILNDSGIIGVFIVSILIIKLFNKLKSRIGRILFVEFIILLCFHNVFPYFQMFWFFLVLIFVFDLKYERK